MTKYIGNDIYCDKIIPFHNDGDAEIVVVAETANVLAFQHTRPTWPVHIVVTPKFHIASLLTLTDEPGLAQELLEVIKEVSKKVLEEHGASRVLTNLGDYQDSKHLHFHISSGKPLQTTHSTV